MILRKLKEWRINCFKFYWTVQLLYQRRVGSFHFWTVSDFFLNLSAWVRVVVLSLLSLSGGVGWVEKYWKTCLTKCANFLCCLTLNHKPPVQRDNSSRGPITLWSSLICYCIKEAVSSWGFAAAFWNWWLLDLICWCFLTNWAGSIFWRFLMEVGLLFTIFWRFMTEI